MYLAITNEKQQEILASFGRLGLHGASVRATTPMGGGVNVVIVGAPADEVDAFVNTSTALAHRLPASVRGVRKGARGTVIVHMDA